jgi:hypothetical protein
MGAHLPLASEISSAFRTDPGLSSLWCAGHLRDQVRYLLREGQDHLVNALLYLVLGRIEDRLVLLKIHWIDA